MKRIFEIVEKSGAFLDKNKIHALISIEAFERMTELLVPSTPYPVGNVAELYASDEPIYFDERYVFSNFSCEFYDTKPSSPYRSKPYLVQRTPVAVHIVAPCIKDEF